MLGRDTRVFRHCGTRIDDVLQHGDAIQRIEGTVAKWQMRRICRGKSDELVVRLLLLQRRGDLRDYEIDSDKADLRNVQTSETHLGQPLAAADVENPVARPRTKRLHEELRELVGPPTFPQVLERRGRESVNRGRHGRLADVVAGIGLIRDRDLAGHDWPCSRQRAQPSKIPDERQDPDKGSQLDDVRDRALREHLP